MALPVRIEELRRDEPLVTEIATLRWSGWGAEEGSTSVRDWKPCLEVSAVTAVPTSMAFPFTLIAKDADGAVVGAVGLVQHDPEGLSADPVSLTCRR